jgi:hypothetical protein
MDIQQLFMLGCLGHATSAANYSKYGNDSHTYPQFANAKNKTV